MLGVHQLDELSSQVDSEQHKPQLQRHSSHHHIILIMSSIAFSADAPPPAPWGSTNSSTAVADDADLEEATNLFVSGLRDARSGNMEQGLPLIACAYLLDSRAVKIVPILGGNDDPNTCLDLNLLRQLIEHDGGNNMASQVLMIYAAIVFFQAEGGLTRTLQALRVSSTIIEDITQDPTMESSDRGILGGCLKRTTLYRMRATLCLSLGSSELATAELTKALELNPKLTRIRYERAVVWAALKSISDNQLLREFRRVILESHPDACELRDVYAWMAKLILENPKLYSYEQAKRYVEKSRQAKARYEELHGPSTPSSIESNMEDAFAKLQTPAKYHAPTLMSRKSDDGMQSPHVQFDDRVRTTSSYLEKSPTKISFMDQYNSTTIAVNDKGKSRAFIAHVGQSERKDEARMDSSSITTPRGPSSRRFR